MNVLTFMSFLHIQWRYKVNNKVSECRTEGSGMDADVNIVITSTEMLLEIRRLDEIIKKIKRKGNP